MGKVFDALRREQKRKQREGERDPLAATISTPDELTDNELAPAFDLAAPIGTSLGPRSNEGMLLPGAYRTAYGNGNGAGNGNENAQGGIRSANYAPTSALVGENGANGVNGINGAAAAKFKAPQPRPLDHTPATAHIKSDEVHERLVMLREPQAAGCEQYRTLRTQIFQTAERQLTQVIVITSALAGEGKTSTALNLAFAIAQSPKRRVLLIDGDLRRPSIANYLHIKPMADFCDVLAGRSSVLEAISQVEDSELYLLPVRSVAANPTELLSGAQFDQILLELREYFDFILIDSPPIVPFADARLLGNYADGTLLVIRSGFAPYETVEQAIETLAAKRILGVVLNGVEHSRDSNYYYNYYYYQKEHTGEVGFTWHNAASWFRESWFGKKFRS